MKKVIALLLALSILAGCCIISASASGADGSDPQSKITPELQALIDKVGEDKQIQIAICFNEDPKTVGDMPSWPDPVKAPSELRDFLFFHNTELALDILGPDYVGRTVYSDYVHYLIEAWYPGYAIASYVDAGDVPRIASDDRVKKLDVLEPAEELYHHENQLDNVLKIVEPDDYICVSFYYSGDVKKKQDFPSEEEYKAYIDALTDVFLTEIFSDTDHVLIHSDMRFSYIEAAVRARDVEKIASNDMVAEVLYCEYGLEFSAEYRYSADKKTETPGQANYLYEFDEAFSYSRETYPNYRELCYHKDENGNTDWVLFRVESELYGSLETKDIIGNRVYFNDYYYPFGNLYGVYDVKEKRFLTLNGYVASYYKDLGRIFDQIGEGRLLGDIDGDDDLTAVDVTFIMRCEVRMRDWPEDDEFSFGEIGGVKYYSDFNRDGERDIVDATKLQRYLIGMDA